jgi:hypothetical protein
MSRNGAYTFSIVLGIAGERKEDATMKYGLDVSITGAGLGFQAHNFVAVGEDADPRRRAEKLDEGLEILLKLWSGEPFSFHWVHYQLTETQLLPKPLAEVCTKLPFLSSYAIQ